MCGATGVLNNDVTHCQCINITQKCDRQCDCFDCSDEELVYFLLISNSSFNSNWI